MKKLILDLDPYDWDTDGDGLSDGPKTPYTQEESQPGLSWSYGSRKLDSCSLNPVMLNIKLN